MTTPEVTTVETDTTLTFSENLEENALLEKLRSQREEGKFCDIVLHVQNKIFPAHRSVLAASSPYFESVLKNHRVTKEEINIVWHDVKTFEVLLDYMYSGCVVIDQQNVYELLKLANHFLITKLKGYCEEYLERFMTIANCLNVKDLAERYNMPTLQETSMNLIRDNINQVLESEQLMDLSTKKLEMFITDPGTGCDTVPLSVLLNSLANWVKKDIPRRSHELNRLFEVINWRDSQPEEIFNNIDNEPLYQDNKLCYYFVLRTLANNDLDIENSKYADIYKSLELEFKDTQELSAVALESSTLDEQEIKNDEYPENSPIVVEPVEVITSHPTSKTPRRRAAKREQTPDSEAPRRSKQKIDNSGDDTKTRKRNVKPKYASEEWITDEVVTPSKRKSPEVQIKQSNDSVDDEDFTEYLDESQMEAFDENDNSMHDEDDLSYDNAHNIKTEYNVSGKKHSASLAQWREGVKCPHCIYVGHSATRLEQHLARVHEEDNTYKCRLCPFTCKWNREYYKHMKGHFEGPPYKCDDCDYTCDRIQFILSHRMRHTDERPFHCELCSFKSRTKGNLIVHMRIHTGEKPYKCQYCGRCFAMKNTLDQHLATHRNDRPFLCDICGFTTKYQSHLLSHKRIHTGNVFHCQQPGCSYFSPRRSQLAAHMRSHLSIRSHICSTCGRGFIEKSHLIRHERIHLEEKPFKCDQCDYGSTRRDKLKEHVLKHHSTDLSASKTPYKPRKPRRQSAINVRLSDEVHSQLMVTSTDSPQEIQITQATHMTEQELATANLIYEYSSSDQSIPTRVVIQPAMGDYGDGTQTVVVEQAKDENESNDSNTAHVVIQTTGASYDGATEQIEENENDTKSPRQTGKTQDLGGLSAFMALF